MRWSQMKDLMGWGKTPQPRDKPSGRYVARPKRSRDDLSDIEGIACPSCGQPMHGLIEELRLPVCVEPGCVAGNAGGQDGGAEW